MFLYFWPVIRFGNLSCCIHVKNKDKDYTLVNLYFLPTIFMFKKMRKQVDNLKETKKLKETS